MVKLAGNEEDEAEDEGEMVRLDVVSSCSVCEVCPVALVGPSSVPVLALLETEKGVAMEAMLEESVLDVATSPPVAREEEPFAVIAPKVLSTSMLLCWLMLVGVGPFVAVDV